MSDEHISDEDLVLRFRDGDEGAFSLLYERYAPRLRRVIQYYVHEPDIAEDVLQDVFIRVLRHADTFDQQKIFSAWVYRIAANCSKNYLKKRSRRDSLVSIVKFERREDVPQPSAESEVIEEETVDAFGHAVSLLKPKFREVLLLRIDSGLKYREIAEVLGCSERTAKWRMKRAVEEVTRYMEKKGYV